MKAYLFIILVYFNSIGLLQSQTFVLKLDSKSGLTTQNDENWREDCTIDFYQKEERSENPQDYYSVFMFTFSPSESKYTNNGLVDLSSQLIKDKVWAADKKTGKRYFLIPGRLPVYDNESKARYSICLYPYAGDVKFTLRFEPIPKEVEEVDVYLYNDLWFKNVKIKYDTSADISFFSFNKYEFISLEYLFAKVSFRNFCNKKFKISVAGKSIGSLYVSSQNQYNDDCYSENSVTYLFPRKYDEKVLFNFRTVSNSSGEYKEANLEVKPETFGECNEYKINCK